MEGFGTITWWGFSPGLDLLDKSKEYSHANDEINVLLIGAGDSRHVLWTLSQLYRREKVEVHFYILENTMELYARHMLFTALTLEGKHRIGLQEKTELFLELHGNTLVRQQTMEYVEKMSDMFIRCVTDSDYLNDVLPILNLTSLKFKERDFLESIFKLWRNNNPNVFDVSQCWDLRIRQHLADRYDSIPGPFDWDYNMKLCDKDAAIITGKKYIRWRSSGVAFEIREGSYDVSNRTLASGLVLKQDGESHVRRGYWGDIVSSPYLSYGIECEDKSFFKTANKVFVKSSEDISEHNVMSILYQIVERKKYIPPNTVDGEANEKQTATITEIDEHTSDNDVIEDTAAEESMNAPYKGVQVDNVKITFLPLLSAASLHHKSKFSNLFNRVYVSNSMVHLLTPELSGTFQDGAQITVETAKFMLDLPKDKNKEFVEKVISIARNAGCKLSNTCASEKDAFINFTKSDVHS